MRLYIRDEQLSEKRDNQLVAHCPLGLTEYMCLALS